MRMGLDDDRAGATAFLIIDAGATKAEAPLTRSAVVHTTYLGAIDLVLRDMLDLVAAERILLRRVAGSKHASIYLSLIHI